MRLGCGTDAASSARTSSDKLPSNGVSKIPGATVATRMRRAASSRASGRVKDTTPPFEAA